MKKILQFKKIGGLTLVQLAMPFVSFAQIVNPLGTTNVPNLVSIVLTYITRVGVVVAIVAFIWSGFVFVRAQGKPAEIQKAKELFFYTVIGVAILLGAQLLASLVVGTIKSVGQ